MRPIWKLYGVSGGRSPSDLQGGLGGAAPSLRGGAVGGAAAPPTNIIEYSSILSNNIEYSSILLKIIFIIHIGSTLAIGTRILASTLAIGIDCKTFWVKPNEAEPMGKM